MISKLPRWMWAGAWALAFVAGMVNVVGLLGFEHQAITHLTGTTSLLAAALAEFNGAAALHFAAIIGSFLAGTLLGLSLAFEPKEGDVMNRPPRDPKRPLLTVPLIMRTGLVSLIMVGGGLGLFLWELRVEQAALETARTVVVNGIVLIQIVYLFNCRSLHHSIFTLGLFTNRWTLVGSLVMVSAQLFFTYAPVMNRLFHSAPISGDAWLRIVGVAAIAFVAVELEKWIRFGRRRGAAQKV